MKKYYPYAFCLSMLLAGNASAWVLNNTSTLNFSGNNGLNMSVPAQSKATIQSPDTFTPSSTYGYLGSKTYLCKFEATRSTKLTANQIIPLQTATGFVKTAACSAAKPRFCCYYVIPIPGENKK